VLRSGGDLDEWLDDVLENAGGDARRVPLIDTVKTRSGAQGIDPRWWLTACHQHAGGHRQPSDHDWASGNSTQNFRPRALAS